MTSHDTPQIVVTAPVAKRRREFSVTPPKFSIVHGYLWVTFAAIFLSMFLATVRARGEQVPGLIGIAIISASSMLVGAAWSLAAILVFRWWQAAPWPYEPGHWLAAAIGFRYATLMVITTYLHKFFAVEQPICEIVTSGILLLPLFSRRQSAAWKVAFGLLLMLCLMPNLMPFLRVMVPLDSGIVLKASFLRKIVVPVSAIVLVVAYAIWERARGVRRDWLHGLGITIWSLYWILDWGLRRDG